MGKGLMAADFHAAAALLGTDVETVMAVAEVESAGGGFLLSGEPKILFEAHIFSRLTNGRFDAAHPLISVARRNPALYRGGPKEHERLQAAVELDRDAALKATSWGMFQLMGFNHARCGFKELQPFITAMYKSEGEQLHAFCRFVLSMSLADELQRKDWDAFASVYNGPKYAENQYDTRLEKAYARFINAGGV
jgi:hypothetical protein